MPRMVFSGSSPRSRSRIVAWVHATIVPMESISVPSQSKTSRRKGLASVGIARPEDVSGRA